MNKKYPYDEDLDNFLKKRYEDHCIEPEPELWEAVNSNLYQRKLNRNIKQVRYLKIGTVTLAAALISLFVYFEVTMQKNLQKKLNLPEIENEMLVRKTNSNVISKDKERIKLNHKGRIKSSFSGINERTTLSSKTRGEQNLSDLKSLSTVQVDSMAKKDTCSGSFGEKGAAIQKGGSAGITRDTFSSGRNNNKSAAIAVNESRINPDSEVVGALSKIIELEFERFKQDENYLDRTDDRRLSFFDGSGDKFKRKEGLIHRLAPISSLIPVERKDSILQVFKYQNNDTVNRSLDIPASSKSGRFFLEVYYSPEVSYRAIVTNSNFKQEKYSKAYFNKRDKADFAFSTGIKVGYLLSRKIEIHSGLYCSEYSQKFGTEAINVLQDSQSGRYFYTSSGRVNMSVMSSDSISSNAFLKSSIRFYYLNIPLLFNYNISNDYSFYLGLNYNYMISHEIIWQAEDYNGESSQQYTDISGLNKDVFSLQMGVNYEIYLNKKMNFIVSPKFNFHLLSLSNTSPVKSYPFSWGLRTGLRYYF